MFLALSMPQNVHFSDRNLYECDTSSGSILNCVFNWARRNNMGLYNTCQYIYLHVQEERFSMYALAVTSWISSYRGCNVCVAVPPFNNYVHLVLAVCLTRDLFWARFGCDPREDFGGGEVGRTCRHDWRIFISTPETKFHRKWKTWQELVNQTAQAVGNHHGRQAVGCLYFGSCEEISGHSKRALKSWCSCRTSHRIRKKFNLPIFFDQIAQAKALAK